MAAPRHPLRNAAAESKTSMSAALRARSGPITESLPRNNKLYAASISTASADVSSSSLGTWFEARLPAPQQECTCEYVAPHYSHLTIDLMDGSGVGKCEFICEYRY